MSEFKVGDRVRVVEKGITGTIYEVAELVLGACLDITVGEYEITNIYKVRDGLKIYINLKERDLELIEKAKEPTPIEDLEQRIEKLEKCVMGEQKSIEKCENVSNFEKMTPKLGIKDFKDMIRPNKMVLNTNDPLEMIWNSTDEEEPKSSLLTEDERVILRNLDKKWKWIARDKTGDLNILEDKPNKYGDIWCGHEDFIEINCYNHLFKFVKFEDDEPYNIEELLKGEIENEKGI